MDLKDIPDSELRAELKRRASTPPPRLGKAEFEALEKYIVEGVGEVCKTGSLPDDFEHYVYEAAMEAVYGKGYWDWHNSRDSNEQ